MLTDNRQRIGAMKASSTSLPALSVKKTITFVAGTTGATATVKMFDVTGACLVSCFATCGVDLTGTSGTLEVGIAGSTDLLLAQITGTALDAGEMWVTNTPATNFATTDFVKKVVSTDINLKITTEAVTGGEITLYCLFTPISEDGDVQAA